MAKLTLKEKQLLAELTRPIKSRLRIAWSMSVCAIVLFVIQAWVLASVLSHWFMQTLAVSHMGLAQQISTVANAEYMLLPSLLVLVLCLVLRPVFTMLQTLIGTKASLNVRIQLRQRLLNALASLGMARQTFGSDGSLSSQVIEQTDALDGYLSRFMVQKQVVMSTPLILLIVCAWQSPMVACILLITAPFVPILMIIIGKMTAKKSGEQFSALAQLSGRFLDWVRGMPTLKRLQAIHIADADLYHASEDYRTRTMAVLKIAFLNGAVLELLSALSIALVAIYLGYGLLDMSPHPTQQSIFSALFVLLLVPEFYAPLRQLGMDYHAQAQAQGAIQSLLPLLEKAEELDTLHQTPHHSLPDDIATINYQTALAIECKDLSMSSRVSDAAEDESETASEAVIRTRLASTSFCVATSARVGLVGESGSGKSSLLQALMGFSEYQGSIIISDDQQAVNHNQLVMNEFRQHIGYLAQHVALLPLTIADNLRLAKPTATEKELQSVLQAVELYDLIAQLPAGLNTQLGERGKGLSGGQQQRLGIAQLLLRDAQLWLLDEPTEHLDPDTAERIHQLLEQVSRDKTVLWITHSVEQLPWLDEVVELGRPQSVQPAQEGVIHEA